MARKTQQVVETAVETAAKANEVANTEVSVMNEQVVEQVAVKPAWQAMIDTLDVETCKAIIEYSKERLVELQKEEIDQLESAMREIQMKIMEMKGGRMFNDVRQDKPKKKGLIITNPDNPTEIYSGFGKRPEWLKTLIAPANGDRDKEREIMKALVKKD